MSNINASEENTESPSTYANDAYKEFRKKEKEKENQNQNESENGENQNSQ